MYNHRLDLLLIVDIIDTTIYLVLKFGLSYLLGHENALMWARATLSSDLHPPHSAPRLRPPPVELIVRKLKILAGMLMASSES